jgi:hypothetical protein
MGEIMFIRRRRSTKHVSHQIIETYREGGKVKQRVIYNLGRHPTIEEALKAKCGVLKVLQEHSTGTLLGERVAIPQVQRANRSP